MVEIDPTEHDIAELGPEVNGIEDIDELEAMLEIEEGGPNREDVKTLLVGRIETLEAEMEDDGGPGDIDIAEQSTADVGNLVRQIDDIEQLESLIEDEEAGEDRDTVKRLIEQRIDSLQGSEETEQEEQLPPEEKYPNLDHPTADKQYVQALEGGEYRDMWVYCETQQGELLDVSKELLGKARELMDGYNEEYDEAENVVAVLIGDEMDELTEEAIAYGADVVIYYENDQLGRFRHTAYTEIYCDMARGAGHPYGREDRHDEDWRDYDEPRYTVFPATNNGRDLSALVQGELDSGLASDCSDLYIEDVIISNPAKTGDGSKKEFQRVLHMPRPDFSGFEYSTILCLDAVTREFHPQGASVIPGKFEIPDPDYEREGQIIEHDLDLDSDWLGVEIEEFDQLEGGVDLTGHDVVVCVGRGIDRDPTEGIELGLELTDAFEDAAFGLTRGIITSSFQFDGHVEQYTGEDRQIGESGQEVEPDLYIAAGVSGAIQHKVGCDESDTIVAINTNEHADIKDWSDYYIHGDLFDVLPTMIDALETGDVSEALATAGATPTGGETDD